MANANNFQGGPCLCHGLSGCSCKPRKNTVDKNVVLLGYSCCRTDCSSMVHDLIKDKPELVTLFKAHGKETMQLIKSAKAADVKNHLKQVSCGDLAAQVHHCTPLIMTTTCCNHPLCLTLPSCAAPAAAARVSAGDSGQQTAGAAGFAKPADRENGANGYPGVPSILQQGRRPRAAVHCPERQYLQTPSGGSISASCNQRPADWPANGPTVCSSAPGW